MPGAGYVRLITHQPRVGVESGHHLTFNRDVCEVMPAHPVTAKFPNKISTLPDKPLTLHVYCKSKMPSTLRSEAARRNGARSRGPITPEGKLASAQSNLKHGLLADAVTIDGECTEAFTALQASLFERLQPEGPIELALVENMVMCRWRQMRLWAMEKSALNHEMRKQAAANQGEDKPTRAALAHRALTDETRSLDNLSRYETRFDRQFSRALLRFNELRTIPGTQARIEVNKALREQPAGKT